MVEMDKANNGSLIEEAHLRNHPFGKLVDHQGLYLSRFPTADPLVAVTLLGGCHDASLGPK